MKPLSEMSSDAILTKPVDIDWSEGYAETWEIVYPNVEVWTLQQCKDWLEDSGYGLPDPNPWEMDRTELLKDYGNDDMSHLYGNKLRGTIIKMFNDEEVDGLDTWRDVVREKMYEDDHYSPMMNYYYPLPNPLEDYDASALEGLPLILVYFTEGEYYALALTGGGMDLSWEICEAHMRLGLLPPIHFAGRLPNQAMIWNKRTEWVAEGATKSLTVAMHWIEGDLQHLKDTIEGIKEYNKERK